MEQVFKTKITEMLGIDHPILCGGMQWISRAEFVAEICNAGGLGFITAESFETAEAFRDEIRKMRDLTDRPFGANLSMLPEFKVRERTTAFCDVVCEEGVLAVETAGRNPEPLMPQLNEAGVKVIHKVTSLRHAAKAEAAGVDAITLIGFEAGGHVGMDDVASFILVPLAASRLKVPVIAGGSICNGRGLLGALAMGAEAVLMGTRFLATLECPIHPAVKERVVQCGEKDTALVMRSIRSMRASMSGSESRTVIATITDRRSGSCSTPHMTASNAPMRSSRSSVICASCVPSPCAQTLVATRVRRAWVRAASDRAVARGWGVRPPAHGPRRPARQASGVARRAVRASPPTSSKPSRR